MTPNIAWDDEYNMFDGTWTNDVMCTECRNHFFVDGSGQCTTESCRELNDQLECIDCNSKNNIEWKRQEDICVAACTWPYKEIEPGVCGIQCNDGHYEDDTGCRPCNIPGCKHCLKPVGLDPPTCFYCYEEGNANFNAACLADLSCPVQSTDMIQNIPVHDYDEAAGRPVRCAKDCEAPNAFLSHWADGDYNQPRCRYCDADCTECKEDDDTHDLYCTKCAGGKLAALAHDDVLTGGDGVFNECVDSCSTLPGGAGCWEQIGDFCQFDIDRASCTVP